MKIDARVEPLVREVLDAAVKKDIGRLEVGLSAITGADDQGYAVQLALAICLYVLLDVHDGQAPTGGQVDALAEEIARDESWAHVSKTDVAAVISRVFSGALIAASLPPEEAVTLPFVIAANLLASSSEAVDGNRWFDYLDEVEQRLESAPGPA
jgi:hypothetical protein